MKTAIRPIEFIRCTILSFHILNAISYCEMYRNWESLVLAFAHALSLTMQGIWYERQYFRLSSILSLSIQSEWIAAHLKLKQSRQRRTNKSGKTKNRSCPHFLFLFCLLHRRVPSASWWNLKQQSIVFLLSRYFCWFINSSAYAFWERLITFQSEMPLSRCAPKLFRKTMIWIQLLKCKKWKNKNFDSVCRILAFFYYDSDPHQWRPIIPRKRNASDTLLQTNKSLKRISLISIRWTNTGCKCNPNKKYNINWEKTNADCASTRTKNVKSKTFSISDSI